jgi:acetyl-CoA carboxylase carboxyl transferase subunit beta
MDWFKRKKEVLKSVERKEIPDGLWIKCEECGEIIYKKELEKKLYVCPKCDYHFRIGSYDYIDILLDSDTFEEFNQQISSSDPLRFRDNKKYSEKYQSAALKTGLKEAVVTGRGRLDGLEIVLAFADFLSWAAVWVRCGEKYPGRSAPRWKKKRR